MGPTDVGTFRIATQFTPTVSGKAQLLSMRGRCLVPFPEGIACANLGQVSLHADLNGRPANASLGTMGFYLLQDSESSWRIKITGHPTGGSFRIRQTVDGTTRTTEPVAYDAFHFLRGFNTPRTWRTSCGTPGSARRRSRVAASRTTRRWSARRARSPRRTSSSPAALTRPSA